MRSASCEYGSGRWIPYPWPKSIPSERTRASVASFSTLSAIVFAPIANPSCWIEATTAWSKRSCAMPRLREAAQRLGDHPAVDRSHQVIALRRRDESHRRHHAALLVAHAQQQLEIFAAVRRGGIERHHALAMEEEAVVLGALRDAR